MGLVEQQNTERVENAEFSNFKKQLIGDAVATLEVKKIVAKKDGKEWIILTGTVINAIEDPKGRETTLVPGDEITKFYDPADDSKVQELLNDLFTCGITPEKGNTEEEVFANIEAATNGAKAYYRTYMGKAFNPPDESGNFTEKVDDQGNSVKKQKIKILSSNKITPENSTPQLPI